MRSWNLHGDMKMLHVELARVDPRVTSYGRDAKEEGTIVGVSNGVVQIVESFGFDQVGVVLATVHFDGAICEVRA